MTNLFFIIGIGVEKPGKTNPEAESLWTDDTLESPTVADEVAVSAENDVVGVSSMT